MSAYQEVSSIPDVLATPSLKRCMIEHGIESVAKEMTDLFTVADGVLGGGMSAQQISLITKLFMEDFYGVPIGLVTKAVRDGVRKATVGHKLTYPLLCSWIEEIRAQVEQHNYDEHMRLTKG